MDDSAQSSILVSCEDYAIAYARIGWSVIPLRPRDKRPMAGFKWKDYQTKRASEDEIRSWFRSNPNINIGIVTGKVGGVFVLDLDSEDARLHWEARFGELPHSIRCRTGKGGYHIYGKWNGRAVPTQAGILDKTDTRGEGGYVVAPPSIHANGNKYEWLHIDPAADGIEELCGFPDDQMEFMCSGFQRERLDTVLHGGDDTTQKPKETKKKDRPAGEANGDGPRTSQKVEQWVSDLLLNGADFGTRDVRMTRLCGWYIRTLNGDKEATFNALSAWNQDRVRPPLPEADIRKIINSIAAKHGTRTFGEQIQQPVLHMEQLDYPDGTFCYNIYLEELQDPIRLQPEDLASADRFRVKVMGRTQRLIPLFKKQDWINICNQMLAETKRIEMAEEETDLSTIREWVTKQIKRGRTPDGDGDPSYVMSGPVEVEGIIYMNLPSLQSYLKTTEVRMNRRELSAAIKKLGFRFLDKNTRMGMHVGRFWISEIGSIVTDKE